MKIVTFAGKSSGSISGELVFFSLYKHFLPRIGDVFNLMTEKPFPSLPVFNPSYASKGVFGRS